MLQQRFLEQLTGRFRLNPAHHRLLLAVSGGVDSVVLAHLTAASGFDFAIAHCNFGLRGAESDRDEAFVRALGTRYGKQVLVQRFDTTAYASGHKMGIQEAARALRYDWFQSLLHNAAAGQPLTHLVTAHHATDAVETMLMHLFRGTGLQGLTGIPEHDPARKIIRPLLMASRSDIETYAQEHALEWVEDTSNTSEKYTRNLFRLNLLPAVKQVYPAAEDNLLHTMHRLKEAALLYQQAVNRHIATLCTVKGNEVHIPVLRLQQASPLHTLLYELLKPYGFTAAQTGEVEKLLQATTGSYVASPTHRVIRNRNWLIIAPQQATAAQHILIEPADTTVDYACGRLQLSATAVTTPPASKHIALLDAKHIRYPLILRPWKQGDYFYPLGMPKKKKLSRFMIDARLSRTEKEKVWVLESGGRIIWIIGHRIDDRCKVLPATKHCLQIIFTPAE